MGEFFVYILKSSVCLALFYLFYRLLLSRETFHRFNRIALLGIIVFSVAIPFIRIMTDNPAVLQQSMLNLEYLLQMARTPAEVPVNSGKSIWLPLLFAIYSGGCLFFFARFLGSTIRIQRLIKQGERTLLSDGTRLVITPHAVSPFSWMGYIVISQKDMEESGEEIITHELAHIHACHSIDMLFCSCCVMLQWFNPAIWLLKQELQNIHEYEADESVITHGVDAKKYQLLLIKKAVGPQRFTSMANSFNHSKLKKRITMMLKQKSNPWARLKYLYVLPLTAIAVVAFARPEISHELEKISSVKINEITPVKVTNPTDSVHTVREPLNIQEAMQKQLDDFSKASENIVRAVRHGSMNNIGDTLNIRINNKNTANEPLIIVDGEELLGDRTLDSIDANTIESISVIKDERALELYGEKARNGVIIIKTKKL